MKMFRTSESHRIGQNMTGKQRLGHKGRHSTVQSSQLSRAGEDKTCEQHNFKFTPVFVHCTVKYESLRMEIKLNIKWEWGL